MKKVLVLLSTYNGEKYLREQIDSIFLQEEVEVYCLVRDDGSNDGTISLLNDLKKIYSRLEFIVGKNLGWKKSFKKLILDADYEVDYYAFADQDDVWLKNKLSRAIKILEKNKNEPALYYSDVYVTNERLEIIEIKKNLSPPLKKESSISMCYGQGCTMVFNSKLRELLLKKPSNSLISHEHWVATVAIYLGKVYHDKYCSMYYRQHLDNIFGSRKKNKFVLLKEWLKNNKNYDEALCYEEIYYGYSKILSEEEKRTLNAFIQRKKNFISRIRILKNFSIKRYSFLGTIFFKINILFGK